MKQALYNFFKGNEGEDLVVTAIKDMLTSARDDNFYIIPKISIPDLNGSREIDVLLLHPILGIYIIEVKNWKSIKYLEENNPYHQVNEYQDIFMNILQEEFGKKPINVEYRVVFPSISKEEAHKYFSKNKAYRAYQNHSFFKEDLEDKKVFERFFNSSNFITPTKEEFLKITSLFVPKSEIKDKKVIPVITRDEIMFFDHKQLSVLNGYQEGLRIIRGVAGTGKTIILTNFVKNKLNSKEEKFLILCFNKNLVNTIEKSLKNKNIHINSILGFLTEIEFDYKKAGIKTFKLDEKYKLFETKEALLEFQIKLNKYLAKNNIKYLMIDETQDLPAGFVRMLIKHIPNAILFIDEAQRFYPYTMKHIYEVSQHPLFKEKIDLRGKVKHLKNVYRTPSNIAKCAFEILNKDKTLNKYYKSVRFLSDNFSKEIKFVLEDGNIFVKNFNEIDKLKKIINSLPEDENSIVLTFKKNDVKLIKETLGIEAMTMASVKGLEADNIIIHNFEEMLNSYEKFENDREIFFRKIYVLLTRAQKNLYISIDEKKLLENKEIQEVVEILKNYTNISDTIIKQNTKPAKLMPNIEVNTETIKKTAGAIVAAAEVFNAIVGFFNF